MSRLLRTVVFASSLFLASPAPGGILAIHDLFPDPSEGGQAPIEIYRRALASREFVELPPTKTLGVLQRVQRSRSSSVK